MKSILFVLLGLCAAVSSAWAEQVHVADISGSITGPTVQALEKELGQFQDETDINIVLRFHAQSPSEQEDSAPGAYMRALSAKLGVLEQGVLVVYFADEDEWRVWIGNGLAARFVGHPGTAAEFTASGEMHDVKEAWLTEVFNEAKAAQARAHDSTTATTTGTNEHVGFQAAAIAEGLIAKLSLTPRAPQ